MEQPQTNETDSPVAPEASIDRREAIAGLGFLGILGLVLVASIAYRVVDASRPGRPGGVPSSGTSLGLASTSPSEASRVEPAQISDPFTASAQDAPGLHAPAADAVRRPNLNERPTTSREVDARYDEEVLGADHIEPPRVRDRPRFVAPGHRSGAPSSSQQE